MRYATIGAGKRIRPAVCLLAARAVGGHEVEGHAMAGAVAVELIHNYSLIHDDLPCVDDDDERRGKPSCHIAFGEAMAVLAGDGLLTEAFSRLALSDLPAGRQVRSIAVLAECAGIAGMVGGQAVDVDAEARLSSLDELESLHRRKTAALFEAAATLGALAGGGDEEQIQALADYGRALGLLFQATDDLLDWQGESATGEHERRTSLVGRLGSDGARARAAEHGATAKRALEGTAASSTPLAALVDRLLERSA
jgi:geranylgeranyl diphosphate synthase type II